MEDIIERTKAQKEHNEKIVKIFNNVLEDLCDTFKKIVKPSDVVDYDDGFRALVRNENNEPMLLYSVKCDIKLESDVPEDIYDWDRDEWITRKRETVFKVVINVKTSQSSHGSNISFRFGVKQDNSGEWKPVIDTDLYDENEGVFCIMRRINVLESIGIQYYHTSMFVQLINPLQHNDFSWKELAIFQLNMMKMERYILDQYADREDRNLSDYDENFIDCMMRSFDKDDFNYIDIEDTTIDDDDYDLTYRNLQARLRIRQVSTLIQENHPMTDLFRNSRQLLLNMVGDACRLGMYEDQLIISNFAGSLKDADDKWSL